VLLFKLAWRNIWRNTRRTLITVLSLTLGVTAIVLLHSYREAATVEMVGGITRGLLGSLQVHGRGYQDAPDMANVVADPGAVRAALRGTLPGAAIEARVVGAGLAGAGEKSAAAVVLGVEPAAAGMLFTLEAGHALADAANREALVGSALARELGVKPGDELVLVGQAVDGSLANDRFTVAGLVDAGSSDANGSTVALNIADAQAFFGLGPGVHQIIVRLPGNDDEALAGEVALLRGALELVRVEVLAWTEIMPEFKKTMEMKARNQHVVDLIVFFIVALGVLNTMSMSTFERTREFGVMASLGTRPRRILGMVVLESLLQGLLGLALGVAIAWSVLHAYGTVDMSTMFKGDVMGLRMPTAVKLQVDPAAVVSAAVTALVTVLLGGFLPALRASRLKPVEASRYV
jgi:ABC-type lipoprotein release transport system permease subunit